MYHHQLDPWPIPKDKEPLYINEPWMIDYTLLELPATSSEPENQPDNVRIYLPMDLNSKAILRRLDAVIAFFGEASEKNESAYSCAVNEVISELEIYDQIWFIRHMPKEGSHSREAVDLAREIILRLADIPDACAEMFPFETIRQLNEEYIGKSSDTSSDPNVLEVNF